MSISSQMNSLKITVHLKYFIYFSIKNYNMVVLECLLFSDTFVIMIKNLLFEKIMSSILINCNVAFTKSLRPNQLKSHICIFSTRILSEVTNCLSIIVSTMLASVVFPEGWGMKQLPFQSVVSLGQLGLSNIDWQSLLSTCLYGLMKEFSVSVETQQILVWKTIMMFKQLETGHFS